MAYKTTNWWYIPVIEATKPIHSFILFHGSPKLIFIDDTETLTLCSIHDQPQTEPHTNLNSLRPSEAYMRQ